MSLITFKLNQIKIICGISHHGSLKLKNHAKKAVKKPTMGNFSVHRRIAFHAVFRHVPLNPPKQSK